MAGVRSELPSLVALSEEDNLLRLLNLRSAIELGS